MSGRDWRVRIDDIVESIEKIQRFIEGMDFAQFRADDRTVDAVLHNLMVIGEAAGRMPQAVVDRHPEIPWSKMRGIRNVVVHEYFGISLDVVWETASSDLPAVAPALRSLLDEESL